MLITAVLIIASWVVLLFAGPFIVDHLENSDPPVQPR